MSAVEDKRLGEIMNGGEGNKSEGSRIHPNENNGLLESEMFKRIEAGEWERKEDGEVVNRN